MATEPKAVWFLREIQSPPIPPAAKREAGYLIWLLQTGEKLTMPRSRPMPNIGPRCHELRVRIDRETWRVVYRIDPDAIVIAEVFQKQTNRTPKHVIAVSQKRLARFDAQRRGLTAKGGKRPRE